MTMRILKRDGRWWCIGAAGCANHRDMRTAIAAYKHGEHKLGQRALEVRAGLERLERQADLKAALDNMEANRDAWQRKAMEFENALKEAEHQRDATLRMLEIVSHQRDRLHAVVDKAQALADAQQVDHSEHVDEDGSACWNQITGTKSWHTRWARDLHVILQEANPTD